MLNILMKIMNRRELYWKTFRRIKQRMIDLNKHNKNLHILKHSTDEAHSHVWDKGFKILENNYRSL